MESILNRSDIIITIFIGIITEKVIYARLFEMANSVMCYQFYCTFSSIRHRFTNMDFTSLTMTIRTESIKKIDLIRLN